MFSSWHWPEDRGHIAKLHARPVVGATSLCCGQFVTNWTRGAAKSSMRTSWFERQFNASAYRRCAFLGIWIEGFQGFSFVGRRQGLYWLHAICRSPLFTHVGRIVIAKSRLLF